MLSIVEIDREHDLAYIRLRPELRERSRGGQSVRVAEDIVLDLDAEGQLIGIELLKASSRLDLSTAETTGDLIVGVKEAAAILGVEKSNFIRDFANKPQFPAPIAELASGRFWLRSDIDRYVQTQAENQSRKPLFGVGELVALQSDPGLLMPVIEVISAGAEYRYRVFQNNSKTIYYESQLQKAPVPADERRAVTVKELHAHLTSLQILSPSTENLFSLRSGRVHFVPYQYLPVLKLIRADRPRLLIADEVGVGKTIEAGLIIKELRARMDISSVLVICPKALVAERKWFTEMKRFDEHFVSLDGPLLRHCVKETDLEGEWPEQYGKAILPFSLFNADLVIGQKNGRRAKTSGLLDLNPPPKFDLVIVDEAHHIRNSETILHQGIRYFCDNAQAVVLLSATPVQIGSDDLFTLLNVLRPDLVIDRASFEQMAAPNRYINAAIQHCRAGGPNWQEDARASLEEAAQTEWGRLFLRDAPAFRNACEQLQSSSLDHPKRVGLTRAIEDLYTFRPLINRTRRRDIGEFTTRKPETLTVEFTTAQRQFHDGLLDVIARILALLNGPQNVKFMMTTIRRQAASCLYGLAPLLSDILNRKLDRLEWMETGDTDEDFDLGFVAQIKSDIETLLEQARELDPDDPKVAALVQILANKTRSLNNKALVFSTFRHTLAYLEAHTRRAGLRVATIHGGVPDEERAGLRARFALSKDDPDAIDVLLSSEVGCEGLDFQFCDFLVNYDLPWNPMRIEQRIGRIDRYGQRSETVAILNFVTPGTVDAEIYERCLWRIGVFQHSVGGNEEILGEITRELHDIEETFTLTPAERAHRLQQVADNAVRQASEEQELESKQSEFFGLNVPRRTWRDEIRDFETFWLSTAAIHGSISTYLNARLGNGREYLLGDRPLKTLRLNQEARGVLLDDYRRLPRSTDPVAREWEKWLRGALPTLSATFEQETAAENPRVVYLSVLHPLVRQAARFLEITDPKYCALAAVNHEISPGIYPFALYRWDKHGIRTDETLMPVSTNAQVEGSLLDLLRSARDFGQAPVEHFDELDELDDRHHRKWTEARTSHVAGNRQLVEHRIQSLTVSHRARRKAIEDQVTRTTDEKIRLMKESELARANADFARRMEELQVAANSGDIRATPVVFGTLTVTPDL